MNAHPRVCSFESRRAPEMLQLLQKFQMPATIAPSMREIPLTENPAAFDFGEQLLAGNFDVVVFLTGVGTRSLWEVLTTRYENSPLLAALDRAQVAVRGPKPLAVLREWKVRVDFRAPEPNTWRELLATLQQECRLAGKRVALQEYGKPNSELVAAMRADGATVRPVPVYRWALPEDVAPLTAAVQGTIGGQFDALLFTSAQQVCHAVEIASRTGCEADFLSAANGCWVGSIGPTCTETLAELGFKVTFEPSHPKMGTLVKELSERWSAAVAGPTG